MTKVEKNFFLFNRETFMTAVMLNQVKKIVSLIRQICAGLQADLEDPAQRQIQAGHHCQQHSSSQVKPCSHLEV
jgi:hypothetical protein